jgi:hypothetical protein
MSTGRERKDSLIETQIQISNPNIINSNNPPSSSSIFNIFSRKEIKNTIPIPPPKSGSKNPGFRPISTSSHGKGEPT